MKYVFLVFDCSDKEPREGYSNIALVGVFLTEQEADDACPTIDYMMACVPVGLNMGEEWPYGYKFPRFDEGDHRLPDDLNIGT